MKRVLLTGGAGFVGSHLVRHLLEKTDWHIICIDSFRHKGTSERLMTQLDGMDGSRVEVITHDLAAPFSDMLVRRLGKIDYIVSMASESHVDRSIEAPREFINNNVQLMLTLLEYARLNPVEKFIQISTDEVYGPAPKGYAHKEWDTYLPSNPYSASKAAQESICFSYWRTFGVPVIITNTMNIIGEMQDSEKFIPMIIKKVVDGEPMTIHASSDGEVGSRFYLHARNQADAILFLLNECTPAVYGEFDRPDKYHIVGEKEVTNLEMAQMVAECVGRELKHEFVDFHSSRPGHDLRYALDGSKMASIGWKAPLSLYDSLKRTINWTLARPEWLN